MNNILIRVFLLLLIVPSFAAEPEFKAKLTKFEIVDFEECIFIGKAVKVIPGSTTAGNIWEKCFEDGSFEILEKQKGKILTEYTGLYHDFQEDGSFMYNVGMFMKKGALVPKGFTAYKIPKGEMSISWVSGTRDEVYRDFIGLSNKAIAEKDYETTGFIGEVCTCERFLTGTDNITLDVYIGVKKINSEM